MTRATFDQSFDPPAPVLPVRIGCIGRNDLAAMLRMLVDTGADCTLIPVRIARSLRLPMVDKIEVEGIAHKAQVALVHAARVRIGNFRTTARVVAFGDEAIVGRDLLNQLALRIDGPSEVIVALPKTKRTRK